ncbi:MULTISPECIES: hypothetical protein [Dyella]|uniref:Secreted protein n=2 Tax=Dyella TaxID=231454 RepID=A0A4R0YS02_9GAMM|nr:MULTISPECIES: hypothetical protein [Dyella]TBR40436.1 hypothetical protein EYV96_09850 [Dyella terrae]TCI11982.1 hypothetical protein EZM97_01020 [Dyella soli]
MRARSLRGIAVWAGLFALGMAMHATAQEAGQPPLRWKRFPSLDESACHTVGGEWGVFGIPGAPIPPSCKVPTKDAGKACKKSAECEGYCLQDEPTSDPSSGMCSREQQPLSCHGYVEDGIASRVCVD